jgi:hypothetical protein
MFDVWINLEHPNMLVTKQIGGDEVVVKVEPAQPPLLGDPKRPVTWHGLVGEAYEERCFWHEELDCAACAAEGGAR